MGVPGREAHLAEADQRLRRQVHRFPGDALGHRRYALTERSPFAQLEADVEDVALRGAVGGGHVVGRGRRHQGALPVAQRQGDARGEPQELEEQPRVGVPGRRGHEDVARPLRVLPLLAA